jgi:hypothetical protein
MKPPSPPWVWVTLALALLTIGHVAAPPVLVRQAATPLGLKRREMKKRPAQPWTSEDEARLRALAAVGRSAITIAERLKRTPAAVRYKALRLNIVLRRVGR